MHEALKCVDAAEPDFDGGRAEVGDGGVVPVGDLSLLGDLQLAVGCLDGQGGEDEGYEGCEAG